jgi:putative redox protein
MADKNKELNTTVRLINNKLHFQGTTGNHEPVSIDYIAPLGDDLGYTSLELFLMSLSSCLGSAMLVFLRRMNKTILHFEIDARGIRKEEHPTGFSTIHLAVHVQSPDITVAELAKVSSMAEEKYCPLWSMIDKSVIVETSFHLAAQVPLAAEIK